MSFFKSKSNVNKKVLFAELPEFQKRNFGLFNVPWGMDDWYNWYNNATFDWIFEEASPVGARATENKCSFSFKHWILQL